jgi:hypothetical protein
VNLQKYFDAILKSVYFSDYEQNASEFLVSYYPYSTFTSLNLSTTNAGRILTCRNNNSYPILTCASSAGLANTDLMRIREYSHLIYPVDANITQPYYVCTNSLGVSDFQFNFLWALTGILIGSLFLFFFISIVTGKKS